MPLNDFGGTGELGVAAGGAVVDLGEIEMVERAALIHAINDAWAMVALLTAAALLCVPFAIESRRSVAS